ncbi:unnamed protein product [Rotaria magnacalcarata]|uniref:Uncharacterized protein n=1 Tax=Rotaria magnacalcarata TaxID=392030 RepID=A0A816YT83_9BILA|nr:unnamed protein product [Rotaria magnacalcarata]
MTFPLPANSLYLYADSFYNVVKQFCGDEAVELLKFQLIDTSMNLLEVDDIFSILNFESDRTAALKEKLGLPCKDKFGNDSFFVMPGIRLKLNKFIQTLRSLLPCTDSSTTNKSLTISSNLIQRYPFLIDFICCCESNLFPDFLLDFISNIVSNLTRTKNLFRYKQSAKDFATSLYILRGRTAYEFVRINLVGSIPSIPSLRVGITSEKNQYVEGEFYFDRLKDYMDSFNCTYAFIGEDCTGVVPKVHYDVYSNCFIGFNLPLADGFPSTRYFSTNLFAELEMWHNQIDKASLLNVHIVQPLRPLNSTSPPPFILSGYGTNGKFTARDILQRWLKIFDLCLERNIRILGYSSDCDPRSLNAMRNAMVFFSKSKVQLEEHQHHFNISLLKVSNLLQHNSSWFFLKPKQLFVCFQDGVHICTKLRNRLLAPAIILLIGEKHASVDYLLELINNCSKLDHALTVSDVLQKDKQNYSSCEKISNEKVLNLLKKIPNSEALQAYLQLIRLARLAFVEKQTSIIDRLYHSWTAIFIVRLWSSWIEITNHTDLQRIISHLLPSDSMRSISKPGLFITVPALFSLELNGHTLTYLMVLVAEKIITEEALNISLFNSQICENVFRSARSMSGPFSTVVNFSINEFLQRVEKLSTLQNIKCLSDSGASSLVFPKHHKQSQQMHQLPTMSTTTTITEQIIEETIYSAYLEAIRILSGCNLSILNLNGKCISFEEVNRLAHKKLTRSQCKTFSKRENQSNSDNQGEDEDLEQYLSRKQSSGTNIMDDLDEPLLGDELGADTFSNVSNSTFNGMRIFDSISTHQTELFFPIEINGEKKYLHKQSANWYFSKTKPSLSSDRSIRVQKK